MTDERPLLYKEWADAAAKMTQPDAQEFVEAVARGEYGQCVPLEQVRAIYAEGFAAGWEAGQQRMRDRVQLNLWLTPDARREVGAMHLEPSPGCPMPEREESEP